MEIATSFTMKQTQQACFAACSDFNALADIGRRNGLSVGRLPSDGDGQQWHVAGKIRGHAIDATVVLNEYMPHEALCFESRMRGISTELRLGFTAEGPRTRIDARLTAHASSFAMRLVLAPLSLQKAKVAKRLEKAIKQRIKTHVAPEGTS